MIVLCCFSRPVAAQVDSDTFLQPTIDLSLYRRQMTFTGSYAVRAENNATHLYQNRMSLGASREFRRLLSLGAKYQFNTQRSAGSTDSTLEHRWSIYATPRIRVKAGIAISDRNMIEIRRISGVLSYRYRNQLQVARRFRWNTFELTPYASLEPTYDTRYEKWSRQPRATVGVEHSFSEHVGMDVYYQRRVDSTPGLHVQNLVSTSLRFHY